MGKRKKEQPDREDIKRKIRKLEDRLRRAERSKSRSRSSSSRRGADRPRSGSQQATRSVAESRSPSPEPCSSPPSPQPRLNSLPPERPHDEAVQICDQEPVLDDEKEIPEEYLAALGMEGVETNIKGSSINEVLVKRWTLIMKSGGTSGGTAGATEKKFREGMIEKYPTPVNFEAAISPTLNAEISGSLSDLSLKRDQRMQYQQNELGRMLSCMGVCLTSIMKGSFNSTQIVEQLNDAAKMAAFMFYHINGIRKFCALSGATKEIISATKNTTPDEFLFGKNLIDRMKSAEVISKASQKARKKDYGASKKNFYKNPPQGQRAVQQRPRGGRPQAYQSRFQRRDLPPPPPPRALPPPPPRYSQPYRRHQPPPPPRYNQRRY